MGLQRDKFRFSRGGSGANLENPTVDIILSKTELSEGHFDKENRAVVQGNSSGGHF